MTEAHRKPDVELAQEVLLDDPGFLREILERVLQELLETEMTEHIGAAPYERTENRNGHRNGHKPRALRTRVGTLNLWSRRTERGPSQPGSSPATSVTRRRGSCLHRVQGDE